MKMLDIKRTIDELLAIYILEEEIVDLYVEGPTDKFIIENFLEYKKINKSIIEIDDIDLGDTKDKYPDLDLRSNKDKLIALSRVLSSTFVTSTVNCIVDKDFDGILYPLQSNKHLLYTDYSCMESYILNRQHIDKLIRFGIKNFPCNTETVIKEISKVLSGLFILRMVNKHFGFNFQFPKIQTKLGVNKSTGTCDFNFEDYVTLYINVNKLQNRQKEILEFIKNISNQLPEDIRYNMNGHDFIKVLFNYVNKIKNTANFKIDNFEKTIYLSVQPNYLEDYPLFNKLIQ